MSCLFIAVVGIRNAVGQPDQNSAYQNCNSDMNGMRTARAFNFVLQNPGSNACWK